ncbi:MAG: transglutaminase domain-containing protein [Dethiobacteria bacterium]|jgi:hypothetical protein|nr:hypothetical protein [Bacillota bacterium]HOP68537.1 transglutaminase domain-containing protein [Bacillota bacterium]HPT33234.1 transglutaminase domain-containing protein [Bacillota bacterium]HQD05627.1 transglutaminase domain-containing protein [Bacillota bacterium]
MKWLRPVLALLLVAAAVFFFIHRTDLLLNLEDLVRHYSALLSRAVYQGEFPFNVPEVLEVSPPGGRGGEVAGPVKELAREITQGLESDYDKMAAIYDWVTHNIAYDLQKMENPQAYGSGAEYVLRTGKGICHDYAELVRELCKAVGLEATYESGVVYPEPGKEERHAWNHVRVDGIWYGLDATWGAGFVIQEEQKFYQKPRRIYLTTPEELFRLHRDPAYKEEREIDYSRAQSAQAEAVYLPEYEEALFRLFNGYRQEQGLPLLRKEERLANMARQNGARIAEDICRGKEYSLAELKSQLNRRWDLGLRSAGMAAFIKWSFPLSSPEKLYRELAQGGLNYLADQRYRGLTLAVVRKGDLVVVVHIYLEYR